MLYMIFKCCTYLEAVAKSSQLPHFLRIFFLKIPLLFSYGCTKINLQVVESGTKWWKMVSKWRGRVTGGSYVHG